MPEHANASYSYTDYAMLPEGAPYQLIQGRLVMSPAPGIYHQIIVKNLMYAFEAFLRSNPSGMVLSAPVDVRLSEENVFQPDLVYIKRDRLSIVEHHLVRGAPDLVIEVLSPATASYDVNQKKQVYAAHGVDEYWIIDPNDRSVTVHRRLDDAYREVVVQTGEGTIRSEVVPKCSIAWRDVFDAGLYAPR